MLGQQVANIGHFYILAVFVVAAQFEDESLDVRLHLFLGHPLNHFRHGQIHALDALRFLHEEGVKHANALREHRDLELMLLLEVVDELPQSQLALYLESIPQRPFMGIILSI